MLLKDKWKNGNVTNNYFGFDYFNENTNSGRKKNKEIDDVTCIVIFLDVKEE